MSTAKAKRQPLSDKHKLIVIITAIALAAVIAVSVTLIVLLQPKVVTPDVNDPSNSVSSSLPVKNGDFGLVGSEDTAYPKSATNWSRYTYKDGKDFTAIETTDDVVMGIVDTDDEQWNTVVSDLLVENITLGANPKQHHFLSDNEKHSNSNVYMIASKNATTAAIISDSVSVSATTSVMITIRVNTSQLSDGSTATLMIQKHSSTPSAKEDDRYAYKYNLEKKENWQELSFYVFNRKTSTQSVRVSVGLGNVYTDEKAEGILFIDDIAYETVTADKYRQYADIETGEGDTTYKIIEKEEETTVPNYSEFLTLKDYNSEGETAANMQYTNSDDYVNDEKYSPFTQKDDFNKAEDSKTVGNFGIYKLENKSGIKTPVALELTKSLSLTLNEDDYTVQDYVHISFWIRTKAIDGNALAKANILVQRQNSDGKWEDLSNGNFTAKTEQDIKTDTNNGWTKYDIYLKPAKSTATVRLVFALGDVIGYENPDYDGITPNGELYVTTPYYETISSSAYSSASSSTTGQSKKFDLAGTPITPSVTNGTFSSVSANSKHPSNWLPVFAGDNDLFNDGKGHIGFEQLSTDKKAVEGSGVVSWKDELGADSGYEDDNEGKILKLTNNKGYRSSFGYVSNNITASAHTVYLFSVLAKVDTTTPDIARALPNFYLIEQGVERGKAIAAKVENDYASAVDGSIFNYRDEVVFEGAGWTRYFIVYVTGDTDTTIKLALFNGSLTDANAAAGEGATIYYDDVRMQTLGTYSMVEDEDNEDAEQYVVKFTAASKFTDTAIGECEDVDQVIEKVTGVLGETSKAAIDQPEQPEWNEMKTIPEESEDDDDDHDHDHDTTTTDRDVDLALLFSILSSVLLIAALAVVVVVKIYRNRKRS